MPAETGENSYKVVAESCRKLQAVADSFKLKRLQSNLTFCNFLQLPENYLKTFFNGVSFYFPTSHC
jgi:hypothetical protein